MSIKRILLTKGHAGYQHLICTCLSRCALRTFSLSWNQKSWIPEI